VNIQYQSRKILGNRAVTMQAIAVHALKGVEIATQLQKQLNRFVIPTSK